LKTAFIKRLSKEVWSDIMQKYFPIEGTDAILVAPTMENGAKEHIEQKFGFLKTKDVFSTDEGLAERQTPFLAVARPIAAVLERLDEPLTVLPDLFLNIFGEIFSHALHDLHDRWRRHWLHRV
jgi:hypothetical protein